MTYKKILSYVIPLFAGFFACVPFIDFRLVAPPQWWPMVLTLTGLAGMYILFLNVTFVVKGVALLGLISCFFSKVPHLSFNAYFSVVACCYFYIGATHMESWGPTFKMLKALLLLNGGLIIAQFFTHDQMLNFGLDKISTFGVVGQHMQEASFLVVLSALLIQIHPAFFIIPIIAAFFCNSTWALCCAAVGVWVYFPSKKWRIIATCLAVGVVIMGAVTHKFEANLAEANRLHAWKRSVEILNEYPWTGWGPGTFKVIFPLKSEINSIPWKTLHNCWLQLAFEVGYPMFLMLCFIVIVVYVYIIYQQKKYDRKGLLAGVSMVACNMLVHFPTRMIQSVLLIMLLLAYCDLTLRRRKIKMT